MKNTQKFWMIIFGAAAVIIAISSFSISNSIKPNIRSHINVLDSGIYKWKITRVIDGDTLEVSESFFPPELKLSVRLKNVDTPEKSPKAKCDEEDKLAKKASEFTKNAVYQAMKNDQEITFSELKWDKYGGRVLSEVKINNKSLAQDLIKNGLGREYHGKKKQSWCKDRKIF
jgi:endonuclease YncB( thermonuclease family)